MDTLESLTLPEQSAQPRYVTYLDDGTLDGCFSQAPAADHIGRMIIIPEEQAADWVNLRANEARDGVEPLPPAPPARVVPQTCTLRQAKRALLQQGKYAAVESVIDSLPSPQKEEALIDWTSARDVEYNSPMVDFMVGALGLSETDKEDLFILAATL